MLAVFLFTSKDPVIMLDLPDQFQISFFKKKKFLVSPQDMFLFIWERERERERERNIDVRDLQPEFPFVM